MIGGEQDAEMAAPGIAQPVHRLVDVEVIEHVDGRPEAVVDGESRFPAGIPAVIGPVDHDEPPLRGKAGEQPIPGGRVGEEAVPEHGRRPGSQLSHLQGTQPGDDRRRVVLGHECLHGMLRTPKLWSPKYAAEPCRRQGICQPTAWRSVSSWAGYCGNSGSNCSHRRTSTGTPTSANRTCTSSATSASMVSG